LGETYFRSNYIVGHQTQLGTKVYLFEFLNSVIDAPQSWRLLRDIDLCDRLGDGASKRAF